MTKINSINKLFSNFYLLSLLLFLILLVPNGGSFFFTGLPWINSFETIFITIFIPCFILLKKNIFFNKYTKYFLLTAFLLKILLLFSPTSGISHKQYVKNDNIKNNNFIKSYDTIWNKNYTKVQKHSWFEKKNFPIDWINWSNENYPDSFVNTNIDDINIFHKINFKLIIDKEKSFKIDTGFNDAVISYTLVNENKKNKFNNEARDFKNNTWVNLKKGIYEFQSIINFKNDTFKLIPYEKVNNKISNSFTNKTIFLIDNKNLSFLNYYIFNNIGLVFDLLLFIYFFLALFIFIKLDNNLFNSIFLPLLSILIIISSIIIKYTLNKFLDFLNYKDHFGSWSISLTFLILASLFFLFSFFKLNIISKLKIDDPKNFAILFFPAILLFWIVFFWKDIQSISFWTLGDDWLGFQYFASKIVLDNQWLKGGEGGFYFRPGIRYVVAILHILFGDSGFSLKMLDVWAILGSVLILLYLFKDNKISSKFSLIIILFMISIFCGENYRYLIGRGLSEYFGMLLMMVSIYLIYNRYLKINLVTLFLCLLFILTPFVREEKIFVALCFIVLSLNFKNLKSNSNNIITLVYNFINKEFKLIIFYVLIIITFFPILFELRNYYYSGYFSLSTHEFVNQSLFQGGYESYYKMLTATTPGNIPRITSIFLLSSFIFSLLNLFIPKFYKINNISISIILLSLILPTIFHNINAYNPRYTIYTLPLSIYIFTEFIYNYFKQNLINNEK